MEIDNEIWGKAKQIVKQEEDRRQYLNDCHQARICPYCGEKITLERYGHICPKCGTINYREILPKGKISKI